MAMIFDPASQGTVLTARWKELVMDRQDAAKLGAQKPFVPLEEEHLRDAAELLYPVHAVGYNWLQSNKVSAQRLAAEIERIIANLAFVACLFLAGHISPKQGLLTMNTSQASEPASAISTFCTGRFLLDMPAGSVLSGGNYRYDFARLDKPKAMSLEEFEAEMAVKENTLRSRKHKFEPSLLRLLVKPDAQGRQSEWGDLSELQERYCTPFCLAGTNRTR